MATIKYMGMEATQEVARFVNAKLAFASAMPVSPIDGQLVLYTGTTTADYTLGGVYRYNTIDSEWELINFTQPIILTYAEFLELPQAVQESGHFIVEDYPGVDGGGTIEGYYNSTDGKFYEDDQYTTEIPGEAGMLYVGLDNDTIYRYDETDDEFIAVGGGNGTVIKYVETLPVSGIENIIYGYDSGTNNAEITADGFLDTDDNFVKTLNTYTAAPGTKIKASADDVTYKDFDSLVYDDIADEFTLIYADTTSDVIPAGDPFYWQIITRSYLAGNAEEQSLTMLNTIPGHEILDDAGTTVMPQRSNIHFPDFEVTDDSTNDITVVNEVPYTAGDGIDITNKEVSVDETRPSTFIGTIAEWNTLTTAQKDKYILVNLTDDGETGDEEFYSTSEVRTNKRWIDGKPIYRKVHKVISNNVIQSGYTINGTTLTGLSELPIISEIIDARCIIKRRTTTYVDILNSSPFVGDANQTFVPRLGTNTAYYGYGTTDVNDLKIIVEYTKSTD